MTHYYYEYKKYYSNLHKEEEGMKYLEDRMASFIFLSS